VRIVIYANCQGIGIRKFLRLFTDDDERLEILNYENYKIILGEQPVEPLLRDAGLADVFIYQPVYRAHGVCSTDPDTENVRTATRAGCRLVSFPYLYNDGLWPLYHEGISQNVEVISRIFAEGGTLDDALAAYELGRLYFSLKERRLASLELLKEREAPLEIQVGDFIEEHILSHELFFVQNHPTSALFHEVVGRIYELIFGKPVASGYSNLVGANYAELPGRYPIDRYCIEEGEIRYVDGPEDGAADYYKGLIRAHHKEWLKNRFADTSPRG